MAVENRKKKPLWFREFMAETIGTYMLILIGDAGVANYVLNRNSKVGVDHFAVAFTFGISAMIGIAASAPISGAHMNPAVTIGFAAIGRLPWYKVPHYFFGQYLGAFLGAATVYLCYFEGIAAFDGGVRIPVYSDEFYSNATYATIQTGHIFSTYPAPWMSPLGTLIDQIIATFSLVFSALIVTAPYYGLPGYLHPFMLGMVICAMVVAFGLQCGAALNPARDLSPRIFQLLSGYGVEAFRPTSNLYWLTGGIIGPHLGGLLGAFAYGWLLDYDDDGQSKEIELKGKNNAEDDTQKPLTA